MTGSKALTSTALTDRKLEKLKKISVINIDNIDKMKVQEVVSGDVVQTSEFKAGRGGSSSGVYDVVQGKAGVNGFNVIAHSTLDVSFVLREGVYSFSDKFGVNSGGVDVSGEIKIWIDHCAKNAKIAFLAPRLHRIDSSVDMPSGLQVTGFVGNSVLDGGRCTRVADARYMFGARDGVLALNNKENIKVERVSIIYPSSKAYTAQNLCGAIRVYGGKNIEVSSCRIAASDGASDINLSSIGVDCGHDENGNRTRSLDVRIHSNDFKCHSGAVVVKGRDETGQVNKTRTAAVKITNNNLTCTQPASAPALNTTGIIKIDLHAKDCVVSENTCYGNGVVKSFIHFEEGVENLAIASNVVNDCDTAGIKGFDGQGRRYFKNVSIIGNTLNRCGILLNHAGVPNPKTSGVVISSNVINEWSAGNDGAVAPIAIQYMEASEGVVVSSNVIKNSAVGGVYARAAGVNISNNTILGTLSGDVITVKNGNNAIISGNTVVGGGRSLVLDNSINCSVSSNNFQSSVANGTAMVSHQGTNKGGNVYTGNVFDSADTFVLRSSGSDQSKSVMTGNNFINGAPFRHSSDISAANNIVSGVYSA